MDGHHIDGEAEEEREKVDEDQVEDKPQEESSKYKLVNKM